MKRDDQPERTSGESSLAVPRVLRAEPVSWTPPEAVFAGRGRADGAEELESKSLGEYGRILWKRKWLIATAGILGGIIGVGTVVLQPTVYTATATVEIQGFNEAFMGINQVDPQAGSGLYSATSLNIATQIRLLQSSSLNTRAMERVRREAVPLPPPQPDVFSRMRARLFPATTDPIEALNEAITMAASTVDAGDLDGTRIVAIRCESTRPDVAAAYVNTLASEFVDHSMEVRLNSTRRTSEWLVNRLDEMKTKLAQAEDRLQGFVRSSGMAFVSTQDDTLVQSKLRRLKGDLAAMQADRIAKQSRYEQVKNAPLDRNPEVMNDAGVSEQSAKLRELQRQRSDLLMTLTPEHSRVKRIDAQIADVEWTLAKQQQAVVDRIRGDYEASVRNERLLASAYASQASALGAETNKASEHAILKREVEITQQLYNQVLQQINQASLANALPTSHMRVVDPASAPNRPSKPLPALNAALGIVLGFVLGFVFIVGKEFSDRTLKMPGAVSGLLNVRELGVIPPVRSDARRRWTRFGRRRSTHNGDQPLDMPAELVTWQQKPSMYAESFRVAISSILFGNDYRGRPKVIIVTSPGASEGKTTVAANMAIAMAEAHRRVVLIDLDFRGPRLHKVFGLPNDTGVSDVLADVKPVADYNIDEMVRATHVPGLVLMAAGTSTDNIMGLLCSGRIRQLVERLRMHFDTVIIDTAPLLPFPEPRIVARVSDGVILVFRSELTNRSTALAALERLREDGSIVLGTILNDCSFAESENAYYHYANL